MKKILFREIPVWGALLSVLGILVLAVLGLFYFQLGLGGLGGEYVGKFSPIFSGDEARKIPHGFQYGEEPKLSDPDYFATVKKKFVEEKTSFLEADLSAMKLTAYQNGAAVKEVPILTKGREGSWWETPAGIYKIESKEKSHFSSFGHVYQPWSMAFQGNFFVHGWPYYEDGTPVSSKYSGGCIRLSDEDAEAIFALAEKGMPVLVFEKDFAPDNFSYVRRSVQLSAEKFFAADMKNNFVFLEKGSRDATAFGGAARLLAGLVSAEYINMEKNIVLDEDDVSLSPLVSVSGESQNEKIRKDEKNESRLSAGMTVTPFDLLHLLLIEHSDQAMNTLENFLGPKRFEALANNKARAIGAAATHFTTSEKEWGTTTPEDLFYLAKYILNNRNFLFHISIGKPGNSAYGETKFRTLENKNLFFDDPRFVGGQVFLREGDELNVNENEPNLKYDFLGVFEISVRGETRPIFIFLANSSDPKADASRALAHIEENFE